MHSVRLQACRTMLRRNIEVTPSEAGEKILILENQDVLINRIESKSDKQL